ncbi:hypothetical protein Tco_0962320 [Tanacetum coccineum]
MQPSVLPLNPTAYLKNENPFLETEVMDWRRWCAVWREMVMVVCERGEDGGSGGDDVMVGAAVAAEIPALAPEYGEEGGVWCLGSYENE